MVEYINKWIFIFELALTPDDEYSSSSFGEIKLQSSNHANISKCKHMQGTKQIFEWDRPKKMPAQQLLFQWTVELPLALKFPCCATCVNE
jgi:hypothetical protein